ncbi:MAG: hypothetical protein ACK550_12405, partial [Synechococcaceae cyanobacterium]
MPATALPPPFASANVTHAPAGAPLRSGAISSCQPISCRSSISARSRVAARIAIGAASASAPR